MQLSTEELENMSGEQLEKHYREAVMVLHNSSGLLNMRNGQAFYLVVLKQIAYGNALRKGESHERR
tara:strand:- start:23 stop:220 length:198 start_codon:yes stop_codon:yes gene_type:complete